MIGSWCNGNTTGFGSVIPSSNLGDPTEKGLSTIECDKPFSMQYILLLYKAILRCNINPNRSLGRIFLDLLLPSCFLTAFVRLPTSALSFHLAVAHYAFDETSAHLLNNRTKSAKDSNDRFGIKKRTHQLMHPLISLISSAKLFYSLSKLSTSLELSNLLSSNLNLCTCCRVNALTSRFLCY